MTESEIQMLLTGVALGAQGMSILHAYWASKDARLSATRAQAAAKRSAGDRYLSSLRIYQLQHRSQA
ncbi:hypothetical protein [Streptomyces sp. AMCC400023]|uniref:hypothetical protein n=1 Tax=Streptomyces sp. AMCC400023 TaxID=2056258 RepID=UPI001F25E91F|nr:hypothetical protein [Streptomyces sp. AMCC400023]UJV41600.1 hypothetical protein CVT30_18620 [Streptomyces sp. AMCC400023]